MLIRLQQQLSLVLIACFILGGCGPSGPGVATSPRASRQQSARASTPSPGDGIPPDQIGSIMEAHYRGLGFMEQYRYKEAVDAFREVHDLAPMWIPGSINLAIALMNDGRDVSETTEQARDLLNDVIVRDPKNLHAHYCRGLILERLGLVARAHKDFQSVVENDPGDAHAWYMLGSTVDLPDIVTGNGGDQPELIRSKLNEQIADFQKALQCNPYLSGASYKLWRAYSLAGDREASRKQLDLWKRLHGGEETTGPGEPIDRWYGGMGRYAEVINPLAEFKTPSSPIRPPRFEAPVPLRVRLAAGDRWVTAADFTGRLGYEIY
ncbi:MAG: tetratricopeptide repeat protein [Isosphaerales bacterium]